MEKIKKSFLAEEVYKSIKEYLLGGRFVEGQKIPSENQLSKTLSVSRVVVRDALSRLRSERLILTYQGKGSFISNPANFNSRINELSEKVDFELFVKVMEFRKAIEFAAINYAVNYATEEELLAVKEIANQMEENKSDNKKFTLLDYEFHSKIVGCSHNPFLISSHELCKEKIISVLDSMNNLEDSRGYAINLHKKIATCLIKKDVKGAIELYKNNGEYNLVRMKELFNEKE